MSGFFTLSGKEEEQDQETTTYNNNNNNSLYLFRNEEIYNKGFELWQQYYQLHHHQQQQKLQLEDHHVDLSLIGGSSSSGRRLITTNYINLSTTDDDDQSLLPYNNSSSRLSSLGFGLMRQSGGCGSNNSNMSISSSSSISMNCQDCGNQAKKDCEHMRCRTCCKSRGFQCQIHVKSTWVPAAKRRERQQNLHLISSSNSPSPLEHQNQQQLSLNPKRQRDNSNPLASTPLPTHTSASGLEIGQFPAEVSSSAVFRCVNVRAVDDADQQCAYQTTVNIGGHVFKGLLYDQGPESRYGSGVSETSGAGSGGEAQRPLNLITATTNAATTGATPSNLPCVTWLDTSSYPTPLNAFTAGTQFFPPRRP